MDYRVWAFILKFAKLKIPSLFYLYFYGQHILLDIYSTFLHCLIVVMFSVGIIPCRILRNGPELSRSSLNFQKFLPGMLTLDP